MDTKQLVGWLVAIGALLWGLTVFNLNIVEMIFQSGSLFTKVIYIVIGLAGAYKIYTMLGGKKK